MGTAVWWQRLSQSHPSSSQLTSHPFPAHVFFSISSPLSDLLCLARVPSFPFLNLSLFLDRGPGASFHSTGGECCVATSLDLGWHAGALREGDRWWPRLLAALKPGELVPSLPQVCWSPVCAWPQVVTAAQRACPLLSTCPVVHSLGHVPFLS